MDDTLETSKASEEVASAGLFAVGLSDAERERLAWLMEECAEVQQVVGKILRHGYESKHPEGGPTNRILLARELGDMIAAMTLMEDSEDVDSSLAAAQANVKLGRARSGQAYMHFQANSVDNRQK